MFVDLLTDIQASVSRMLFRARLEATPPPSMAMPRRVEGTPVPRGDGDGAAAPPLRSPERPADVDAALALGVNPRSTVRQPRIEEMRTNREEEPRKQQPVAVAEEVGRNDPCPCGSGKKYKKCHGR